MPEHSSPLVNVEDLVIAFRNPARRTPFYAVDGVTLSIRAGEALGLVGESGSGKTTLAKAVLRLYQPTAGRVVFDGTDITRLGEASLRPIRRKMQMVFQDPLSSFNPRVRIGDAVSLPLRIHKLCEAHQIDMHVDQLLTRVGLGHQIRGRYPHEMSGGQLQRVAIARALALRPRLIVADEPVSKLDVSVRAQILNLLREVQKSSGIALLFITHDLRVARYLCDRIGVMFYGRLVEIARTEEAFACPRHPYTRALLSTLDEEFDVDITIEPPLPADAEGCHYRTRCSIAKAECARDRPRLEPIPNGHQLVACPYVLEN
jgi:oligopeptide/dipeptide ABC transporter ATP-binding protein